MITNTKPTPKALVPKTPTAVVKWKGEQITVTFNDVRNLICRQATDQEIAVFLKTCQSLQLNPFANEVYLIKYTEREKAAIVVSIGSYLKAAEMNKSYNGNEAGIILKDSGGKLEFREGAFLLDDEKEKLVGGWAKVYRKNRGRPTYMAVNKAECVRYTREGEPTRFWTEEKQASMLRKTALKRALVEAFPSLFAGTISTGEIPEAEYEEIPEGELPPALEKGGQPDWKKFWARVKSELGLTTEEARLLLQVDSIKEELLDQGWTMEQIWDGLVTALQQQNAPEIEPEQDKDLFGEREEQAGAAAPEEAETAIGTAPMTKRDPETIRTINDLLKACNADFKMQPKDVYAELNVNSASGIAESASECYRRIAAARG